MAELYAGKSDLELSELSQDGQSLTEDARGILQAEVLRRELKMEPARMMSTGEPDSKIVTIPPIPIFARCIGSQECT